jgi:signal transduction histidine kinase
MIFELLNLNFNLDFKNLFLTTFFVVYIVFGFVILRRNYKDKINLLFFFVLLTVSFWTLSMIFYRGFKDVSLSVTFARILYFSATLIPITFTYFVFNYSKIKTGIFINIILILFFLYIALISILPNFLIKDVMAVPGKEKIIIFDNKFHILYAVYIILYFSLAFYLLFKFFLRSKEISELTRVQIYYLFLGTLIPAVIGVTSNLILPLLGYFELNWLGQIGVISLVILLGYAVLKYQLFNIKIILTEVFVFSLIIIFLLRTLLSFGYQDMIYNGIFTILVILLGILLIRSVYMEVEQREKLEELNRLKSEFLSFASHQVKSPMTNIKGFIDLILDGIYGEINDKIREILTKVKNNINEEIDLVDNLLDLRKIEEGRMEYNFAKFDLLELIREICDFYKIRALDKGLGLNCKINNESIFVNGDREKLKQVFNNLVDNAIKYTNSGFIEIDYEKSDSNVVIKVKDTGIGIKPDLLKNLFGQFIRDPSVKKTIKGTGLGLFIAKEIIKVHQGKIWAESEGEGKGSTFYVELPILKEDNKA